MERVRIKTNLSARTLGSVALALAAVVLVVIAALLGPAAPGVGGDPLPSDVAPPSDPPPSGAPLTLDPLPLPPDVVALGTEITPLAPDGLIPLEQAVDVAIHAYPFIQQGQIDAYLVEITDLHVMPSLQDRPIWIIKASGLSAHIFSVPVRPDGTTPNVGLAEVGYIYVDAVNGELGQALFQGGPATE